MPATVIDLLRLHNEARAKAGERPLALDGRLVAAARKYAEYLDRKKTLGHRADGRSPGVRVAAEGYRARSWGENVGFSTHGTASVTKMWLSSSGHRANILRGAFTEVGFGVSGTKWVAVFAAPRR